MLAYNLESNKETMIEVGAEVLKMVKKIFKGHKKSKDIEVYNYLMFEVNEKEQLVVSYVKDKLIVQKKFNVVDVMIEKNSSFLLPIQALKEIKNIKKHEIFKFMIVDDNTVMIDRDGIETTISTLDVYDFPRVNEIIKEEYYTLETKDNETNLLKKEDIQPFLKATKSVSTSETRPVLTNVALMNGEIVSTDSHRLFKGETVFKDFNGVVTMPTEMFSKANDLLDKNDLFMLGFNDREDVKIFSDDLIIVETSATGNYPNIERLIPNKDSFNLEFTVEEIHKFITAIDIYKGALVTLEYDKNNKEIELKVSDIDKKHTSITRLPVVVKNDNRIDHNFKITFSAYYVKTAIEQLEKNYVTFKFISNMRPFLIDTDFNNDMALVLPIRVY